VDRFAASSMVASVGAALRIPIGQNSWSGTVEGEGIAATPVEMSEVGDGYFPTLSTPIVTGRDFARADNLQSPRVVIISQALATALYGTTGAIGRQIRVPIGSTESPPLEIIGVAADSKLSSLRDGPRRIVYLPLHQNARPGPYVTLIMRTTVDPSGMMPEVRRALSDIDPRFTSSVFTLEQQLADSLRLERVLGLLSGFFGVLALLLAGLGLYGIVSYMTARRRSEIGIRIALGAASGRVVRMVLGEAGSMVLIGIGVGVGLSFALTRLVASFLYGVAPNDPLTLMSAAMVLIVVAAAAAAAPARRAARSDPVAALRADG
jgi:putative ABC transport system permease protein